MDKLNNDDLVILWLTVAEFLNYNEKKELLNLYNTPKEMFDNFNKDSRFQQLLHGEKYDKLLKLYDWNNLVTIYNNIEKMGIKIITYKNALYSKLLLEIPSFPLILFCKGNLQLLNSKCIAIVGTRRITNYGIDSTRQFARDLASVGFTIVSGLAEGVDTVAHETTLKCGGKTIAVIGSGFNNIYPVSNIKLYNDIIQNNGLVISEFMPNVAPLPYNFPIRNRIIVGLCDGVLITEATEKSGTMHTKNYAIDFNRDIFVIPGRINDIYSVGCNNIIKNCEGAMVLNANDILNQYDIIYEKNNKSNNELITYTLDESVIITALQSGEKTLDDLIILTNFEVKKLTNLIMKLSIKGNIKKLVGNLYSL